MDNMMFFKITGKWLHKILGDVRCMSALLCILNAFKHFMVQLMTCYIEKKLFHITLVGIEMLFSQEHIGFCICSSITLAYSIFLTHEAC